MSVRRAVAGDADQLCVLVEAMHAESRYSILPYAPDKIAALFARLLDWPDGFVFVACDGEKIVGFLAGFVVEHFASHAKIAGEYGLFIEPARRGGTNAARLLKAYRAWADERGAVLVSAGITTGVNVESTTQFYESLGGHQVGVIFEFKG